MTLQFPLLSPVSFPATEKNKESIVKMSLYKSVIGRKSDYDFDTDKPFSFKFPDDTVFSQTKSDSRDFPNGFSVDVVQNGVNKFIDFVEDESYIYALYYSNTGATASTIYKIAKNQLLKTSPVFTQQIISVADCEFEAKYHRHMAQDSDFLYVVLNAHTNASRIYALKVQKADMSVIVSDYISTVVFSYIGVFDVDQDSHNIYVAGRSARGASGFGGIFSIIKSPFGFVINSTIASTELGSESSSISVPEDNIIFHSGGGGDKDYGTMFVNNGATIDAESKVMITHHSDDNEFLTNACDVDHRANRSFVRTQDGARPYVKGFDTVKGLGGKGTIYYAERFDGALEILDFVISTELNFGGVTADSEDILNIGDGVAVIRLFMDNAGVLNLTYNPGAGAIVIAQGSVNDFVVNFTTAQPYQTLRILVSREYDEVTKAMKVSMKLNDVDCIVASQSDIVMTLENNVFCELGADFAGGEGCVFRSIKFYSKALKILDQEYELGGMPNQQTNRIFDDTLFSVNAAFYRFDEVSIGTGNRINCLRDVVFFDSCDTSNTVRIGKLDTITGLTLYSDDLDGFASISDEVIKVLRSTDGYIYFLSRMYYQPIANLSSFNLSCMTLIDEGSGMESFSFVCNRQDAEFKFAPNTVGIYQDDLVMTSQTFSFDGICYEPDFAYVAKCPIIKMGEGHKDMLRFADTPATVSVDFYSRAESGFAGTRYIYDSYNANFFQNTTGKFKKVTKSLKVQSVAEVFESWVDSINLFYDWSDGKLVKDSPVSIFCVMGVSAMRMDIYTALDTNYNFNDEGDPQKCGTAPETSLLSNTNVFVTGAKQVEILETRLDNRVGRSIKFRIKAETGEKYDSFKVFEIRYAPTDAFFIAGDSENAEG